MLKNKSKFFVLFIIATLLLSTLCFATDETGDLTSDDGLETTSLEDNTVTDENAVDTATDTDTDADTTVDTSDIRNDNLYLADDDVVMDELVDGNVFLFGNNVEVTGQVNGNVFVFGNTVTFSETSYVINSVYIFANTVEFKGLCSDLYVMANRVNIPYSDQYCFIFRDLNVVANSFTFAGGVGRNANVTATKFNFVTTENAAGLVYGDLNYSASNELELSSDFVEGNINYSKVEETTRTETVQEIIVNKLVSLCSALLIAVVVYLLALLVAPKFVNKTDAKLSSLLPALGIGVLSIIAVAVVFIALMFTVIGVPLGFIMLAIYLLLFAIAFSILAIYISNIVKSKMTKIKIDKNWKFIVLLLVVSLVMWLLEQIPYIGGLISFLILMAGIGLLFMTMFGNIKNVKCSNTTSTENAAE